MSVLVVGTVAFDSIETPFGSAERILGGSAAYFALGASFFAPVRVVGVVGRDFPQDFVDVFTQRNIDLDGLERAGGETFHWRGRYHEDINLRDTLELHLNVLAGFEPKLPDSYRDAEYVFLGNIDPAMQMEVLRQIRRLKLVACDTMDHWIRESPQELKNVLQRIEILFVEAHRLLFDKHFLRSIDLHVVIVSFDVLDLIDGYDPDISAFSHDNSVFLFRLTDFFRLHDCFHRCVW